LIRQAELGRQYESLKTEIDAAVARVLTSGHYVGGPEVEGFEREFARTCGVSDAVAVGNGTDALRLALIAAGVGDRDGDRDGEDGPAEVITSPLSFLASTEAITQAGARPVFADIDRETFNLAPAAVERALTKRTRAILPVHLYGHPADIDPIRALAKGRGGISILEDACQAHGALYKGKPAGSLGEAAAFSFYPTKNLGGCGEGGMVTTTDPEIAARVRRLRDHGQEEKYRHVEEGYNARMDALQAAILRIKLARLGEWNERRRSLADRYRAALADAPVVLPVERPWGRHIYHLFTIRTRKRDRLRSLLRDRGIDTGVHYPVPLHLQPCYAAMGLREGAFPEAESAAREILSLPLYPEMRDGEADEVAAAVIDASRKL
jgi:dTDP-4-amino-4,6-dideoxygalactose transaminase